MAENGEHHNRLVQAYERMLERLNELLDSPRPTGVREGLDRVKQRTVELGELSREEAERIGEYLRRDIEDAAQYVAKSDTDYSTWLHMDLQLLENWIWDSFTSVADRTRLELLEFQQPARGAEEYRTGEVAAPGSLSCLSCGRSLNFERAAHIPPCPQCHATSFVRTASREAVE
jgi:predicted RNA-binding Zn-ribbon protein involved in translation (DUF1610 family)